MRYTFMQRGLVRYKIEQHDKKIIISDGWDDLWILGSQYETFQKVIELFESIGYKKIDWDITTWNDNKECKCPMVLSSLYAIKHEEKENDR